MADSGEWTLAIGCRKAAIQIAIRLPFAVAICWAGFWLLKKLIESIEGGIQQEISHVGMGLLLAFGVAAGAAAGLVLSRKLSEGTGLPGNHLLLAICIPLVAGLLVLQLIVGSVSPEWTMVSAAQFTISGIAGCIMMWWQMHMDS
jgi:hypothetical protein